MFKTILLPTDGSRHSEEAARLAAREAKAHGATVHPLVAVEFQYLLQGELPEELTESISQRINERARHALDRANELLREAGVKTDGGRIVEAPPDEAILDEAVAISADLIVMGSRGVSLDRGRERLLGSVAERVLHRTPCPVLVIRAA